MNAGDFITWAFNAQPGDKCVYFRGALAFSRYESNARLLADTVRDLIESGTVTVTQRLIPGVTEPQAREVRHYEYIATRLKKPVNPRLVAPAQPQTARHGLSSYTNLAPRLLLVVPGGFIEVPGGNK